MAHPAAFSISLTTVLCAAKVICPNEAQANAKRLVRRMIGTHHMSTRRAVYGGGRPVRAAYGGECGWAARQVGPTIDARAGDGNG